MKNIILLTELGMIALLLYFRNQTGRDLFYNRIRAVL